MMLILIMFKYNLSLGQIFDKVLQKSSFKRVECNTLSRGLYDQIFTYTTAFLPFLPKAVLEDRGSSRRNQIFHSFSSTLLGSNRILPKFHPQRPMAYPKVYSQVRQGRTLVFRRNRLLQGRELKQHHYHTYQAQLSRNDCRTIGSKTPHQMSHPACSTLPSQRSSTGKSWSFLRLFCCRPSDRQDSVPSPGGSKFALGSSSSGNSSFGFCRIYSKSRSQLRAISLNTQIQEKGNNYRKTDRKSFYPVRCKKNSANRGAQSLWALKLSLERLCREIAPIALFPSPPVVRFVPEVEKCRCGHSLRVQKTREKTVFSLTGPFVAHETLLKCDQCSQVYSSESLRAMVPQRCNVAFDVLVFVGRALFQRHQNVEEVQAELMDRNVRLCASEIDYLGRKFIAYLALAHSRATPRIRQKMQMAGGYVLHLDATHEGEAPALMSGMDSLSQFVLANVKIPSENADHIVPFLQDIQNNYGTPIACVHDMGTGICKAVSEVLPGIRDFICHFHFLRDIGKDFLEPAYTRLRKRLRKHSASTELHSLARQMKQTLQEHGIEGQSLKNCLKNAELPEDSTLLPFISAYSLALWTLHGKQIGNGYGFPFDRPLLHFAERLLDLDSHLPELLKLLPKDKTRRPLRKLSKQLSKIGQDQELLRAVKELRWRTKIFDDLRTAMRIAQENENKGLNDDGDQASMTTIRQEVKKFRDELQQNSKLAKDGLCQKIVKQIDKYEEKLFADPIEVSTPKGKITIYPQRTNNIMEQFFRSLRRTQRRKTGNNSLRQMLYTMLADTPLIKNLENTEYMEVLLDGKSNLEELFASLDQESGFANNEFPKSDRIISGFRSVMKLQNLPERIIEIFTKKNLLTESN